LKNQFNDKYQHLAANNLIISNRNSDESFELITYNIPILKNPNEKPIFGSDTIKINQVIV